MEFFGPIFWHQGLFLQPHHFQLIERGIQTHLDPFLQYLAPYFWGVCDLDIQESSLGIRSFQVSSGSFVFPDGTHAVLHGNAVVGSRIFEDAWVTGGKPFTVFLGLKKWNNSGENVTVTESPDEMVKTTTRFASPADPEEWNDLHSGGPPAQVKRLFHVLKIFWETEQEMLGDYMLIPIARLERMGEEVVLSQRFVPPSLTVCGMNRLLKIIKDIRDQLASRCRQLEGFKRQRGVQTAQFGSRDMIYLLALRSLNRYVPLLFHLSEAKQVHPWVVFGELRRLIGEFSTFSEKTDVFGESSADGPESLPVYDHRNLWECFTSAQSIIARLLDEITAGPDYIIPLVFDGTYFAAEMKPAHFAGRNRFYLVLRTEQDHKSVLESIETAAKLSSRERLPLLIARALPGVNIEHLPIPPQELPRKAWAIYFAVDSHNDQWSQIEKGNNIALYWDNAPEDLEVELMLVGKS